MTALIHDMASLALELKDHATYQFLQWFIGEQVEEESTASDFLQKFKLAGEGRRRALPARQGARHPRVRLAQRLRLVDARARDGVA